MASTTANGNKLTKTLDEWKNAFTEDAYDDYINNRNKKSTAEPTGSGASNNKGTYSNGNGEKQIKVSQRKKLLMVKTDTDKLLSLVSLLTRKDSRRVRPVDLLVEISCGDSIRL